MYEWLRSTYGYVEREPDRCHSQGQNSRDSRPGRQVIGLQEDPLVGICSQCPIHHQHILREAVCYRLRRVFGTILQACGIRYANWHHPVGSLGRGYSLVPMRLARTMELR